MKGVKIGWLANVHIEEDTRGEWKIPTAPKVATLVVLSVVNQLKDKLNGVESGGEESQDARVPGIIHSLLSLRCLQVHSLEHSLGEGAWAFTSIVSQCMHDTE